jgi:hypothetical protein
VITGSGRIREAFAGFLEAGWRWEIKLVSHHRVGDIALNTVEHALRKNSSDGDADTLRLVLRLFFANRRMDPGVPHRPRSSLRIIGPVAVTLPKIGTSRRVGW